MGPVIEARGLAKTYKEGAIEVHAVGGVDIDIKEGELIGLFGPSGSGKTTLLSMLGCILRPTGGSLHVFGNDVVACPEDDMPSIRQRYVSFIFQGFNLFPALTVFENVMLVLELRKVPVAEASARAEQLIAEVGLAERSSFLPRDLSGGQKQRVAIARALAADSPIIIADEPTGNLDHGNGEHVMQLLRSLSAERRKSVIVATHDNRTQNMFDRILYMEDGRISGQKEKMQ
jgi:putative ABC transport system ATP-binding protein